jgi:hypothetical protein
MLRSVFAGFSSRLLIRVTRLVSGFFSRSVVVVLLRGLGYLSGLVTVHSA